MKEENKKRHILLKFIIVLVVFCLGVVGMYLLIHFYPNKFIQTKNIKTTKLVKDVSITDTGLAEPVDKIYDAVVVVETHKNGTLIGSGTGFVYKKSDKEAYILTNNHVIASGNKVYVTFTNEKKIEAEIIGSDTYADIAVLSIKPFDKMKVASIGSSKKARIGDTVFTVGAPLDSVYSWTVTRGILSGKDRMIEVDSTRSRGAISDWIMSALQTDAAINEGNSGGPLCNVNGEVIGITSLKLVSGSIEGMGFAIPIETAVDYADKMIKGDKIIRPYIGVSMYNVSELNPTYYDSDKVTAGVYIDSIEEGSPAAKAGLKRGDIIVKVNDADIKNIAYFKYNLYKYEVGEKVTLIIFRGDDKKKIEVTLGENSD